MCSSEHQTPDASFLWALKGKQPFLQWHSHGLSLTAALRVTQTLCLALRAAMGFVLGANTELLLFPLHWRALGLVPVSPAGQEGMGSMGGKELLLVTAPLLTPLCVVRGCPWGQHPSCPWGWCSAHRAGWCGGCVPAGAQLGLAEVPFSQSCQKLCGFPSLPSHKLLFTSPYGSLAGSSPVSHRLPLLSSCLQVPNQNVAPQYL